MQLFVRGQELHTIDVTGGETVDDVVSIVAQREGLDVADVAMFYGGSPLAGNALVCACASELSTIELEVRMLGGKVHGSLARAGKVKGQTPKVEKGEKKKKKTGRAKRRMQYNRRFVNVVAQFGRKKGPNSNSQ
jgi:small subunit ribosomal protein S30e